MIVIVVELDVLGFDRSPRFYDLQYLERPLTAPVGYVEEERYGECSHSTLSLVLSVSSLPREDPFRRRQHQQEALLSPERAGALISIKC